MPLFRVLKSWSEFNRPGTSPGFYLIRSSWDDYTYKTTFSLSYVADKSDYRLFDVYDIGNIKIGYENQEEGTWTYNQIPKEFDSLGSEFFSLAESPDFYESLYKLGHELCMDVLEALNCLVLWTSKELKENKQDVLITSLMRDVNINTVFGQFARIVVGKVSKEKIEFNFIRELGHDFSDLNLSFSVDHESLPPSNIHAIIGRNGLGKTTLLNEMVSSFFGRKKPEHAYFQRPNGQRIQANYFSTVVSISFSSFDPFRPPQEKIDQKNGTGYYYIGLKVSDSDIIEALSKNKRVDYFKFKTPSFLLESEKNDSYELNNINYLREKYANSVVRCFSNSYKEELWIKAIESLETDLNFRELQLTSLADIKDKELLLNECIKKMKSMSSGHLVVFMTISRLVEVLQEKTLIIFDEPETHLHPPLLSAFIRTLSELLTKLNGVAILATHSPVVLQEIPKKCCWVLRRSGTQTSYQRPGIETFAENVGVITKEVFQLETERTEFNRLLKAKVDQYLTYEEILEDFDHNIGYEGKAMLMGMIMLRDSSPLSKG